MRVTVVGAGVIGLTCALELADRGADVRVVAEHRGRDTTSYAAGAMVAGSPGAERRHRGWVAATEARLRPLIDDPATGVSLRSAVVASRTGLAVPADTPGRLTGAHLPGGFERGSGLRHTLLYVCMPPYLAWLERQAQARGVAIDTARVTDLDRLSDQVVVNAAGWQAGALAGDPTVTANRGQHVVVRDPGLTDCFWEYTEGVEWISWMLHDDPALGPVAVCGGYAGGSDLTPEPIAQVAEQILARCAAAEPRLAGAEVLDHRVGFRPARPEVRVERQVLASGRRVVHCYGHAGSGVAWSVGSAVEAADLALGPD